MNRSQINMGLLIAMLVWVGSTSAQVSLEEQQILSGRPPQRPPVRREIWITQYEPNSREKKLLAPMPEDVQAYASLLQQPGTGLVRIFPAGRSRVVSVDQLESGQRPGFLNFASIYSFSRKRHGQSLDGFVDPRFGWGDLRFHSDTFMTGFTGSSLGLLVNLGDVPMEKVTASTSGVTEIAEFKPPANYTEERHFVRICRTGFNLNGFFYRASLRAFLNTTYALRSITNKRADMLVAFRVVREHPDGSFTLLWKKLKTNPKPSWKRRPD